MEMGQFGSKKYAGILAELEAAGDDLSAPVDVRVLYLKLGRLKGMVFSDGFLPSHRQCRLAFGVYKQNGVLADLSKAVAIPEPGAPASSEDVLALSSQSGREGNIVRLFLAQGGRCHYCGCELLLAAGRRESPRYATIDHVVPRCQGGTKSKDNVVAACADCNSRKGHMAYHLFLAMRGQVA